MKNFRAVTHSGTVYESRRGVISIQGALEAFPYSFMAWKFKVVKRDELPEQLTIGELFDHIHALPEAEVPEVGKSIFVAGKDDWRLSTAIAELEVRED